MKLLRKTILNYFIYSVIVLIIAIPVFYFVIQRIVKEDIDEDLMATKEMLKPTISEALLNNTIDQLKFLDNDITISVSSYKKEFDSLTTIEIYDTITQELVPHRVLTSHVIVNGKPFLLQVKTSLVDNEDLIKSIVQVQIILLLFLLAGLFVINRSLSKRIWKPFYTTLDKLRNYKIEKHQSLDLAKSFINEFDDLNKSLEELTDRTHQSYLSQKEFAENASHELQTPLAVFQSKLELLMQTSFLNEEQAQLIGDLADASRRMARLNKTLVLLTKIENNQFSDKDQLSLNDVINKFIQLYQPQASQKQITVKSLLEEEVMLEANKTLIEILAGNLLANAIRHNYINGAIQIVLQSNILTIQNTGKLSALDDKKLFKRFQKESTDSNSIGLGLTIVKKICAIYQYSITYQFSNGLHTFSVVFNNS